MSYENICGVQGSELTGFMLASLSIPGLPKIKHEFEGFVFIWACSLVLNSLVPSSL